MCNVQFREGFALTRYMALRAVNVPKVRIIFARRANIIPNGVWGAAPPIIEHCTLLIVN